MSWGRRLGLLLLAAWVVWGFWAVSLFSASSAFAFPENVRHGYINCNSCHVNPNGSGQLNPYGRQMSRVLQSYGKFFFEFNTQVDPEAPSNEGEFLYGWISKPDWLLLGGDFRFVQSYVDSPSGSQARFIVMQLDFEAAVRFGRWTIDASIGRDDPTYYGQQDPVFWDYVVSHRHYVLFQATREVFLMAGRYWKPYGINDARHISLTKRGLGWDFNTESYNAQVGYLGKSLNLTAYADFGRPDDTYQQIEKGGGATASVGIDSRYKIGFSYFYGYTETFHRHVFGPWGILGFTDHFYLRTENNFFNRTTNPSETSTFGFVGESRLGYEMVRGFHVYTEVQWGQFDFNQDSSRQQYYGVGILYYPRAHWEFELNYQKRKSGTSPTQSFTDYAYILFHYYL